MAAKYFSKAVMFSLVELSTSSFMEHLQWIGGKYHGFGSGGAICTTGLCLHPLHRGRYLLGLITNLFLLC